MRFLTCSSDATPCPPEAQAWTATAEILDPSQFGITPTEIAKVATWGFGVVILGFFLGYQLGCYLGIIKRL